MAYRTWCHSTVSRDCSDHRPLHRPQIHGRASTAAQGASHIRTAQQPVPRIRVWAAVPSVLTGDAMGRWNWSTKEVRRTAGDHERQVAEEAEEEPAEPDEHRRPPPADGHRQGFRPPRGQDRERQPP